MPGRDAAGSRIAYPRARRPAAPWIEPLLPPGGCYTPSERPGHGLAGTPALLLDCKVGGSGGT